jgi:hypothetical protein
MVFIQESAFFDSTYTVVGCFLCMKSSSRALWIGKGSEPLILQCPDTAPVFPLPRAGVSVTEIISQMEGGQTHFQERAICLSDPHTMAWRPICWLTAPTPRGAADFWCAAFSKPVHTPTPDIGFLWLNNKSDMAGYVWLTILKQDSMHIFHKDIVSREECF